MKPAAAPITIGLLGGLLAIGLAATITGPVFWAVDGGGSPWLLGLLFLPLGIAALGLVAAAWLDKRLNQRAHGGPVIKGRPYIVGDGGRPELFVPPVPAWHTIDEELPAEHSAIELEMMRQPNPVPLPHNGKPPFGMAIYAPRQGDGGGR